MPVSSAARTGQIDREALDYFRFYFKAGANQFVKIKNIRLEATSYSGTSTFAFDLKDLDLTNNVGQAEALIILADNTNQINQKVEEQAGELSQLSTNLQALSELINGTDLLAGLADQVVDHETRIQNLEASLGGSAVVSPATLSFSMQELDSHLQASETVDGYLFDIDGNLKVQKVETEEIKAGDYVVKENVIPSQNNVGSVIIRTGEQEVLISNEKVRYNSKIIVTPVGASPVSWVISDKIDNVGFKIKLDKPAEFDIAFDYWVIGVE